MSNNFVKLVSPAIDEKMFTIIFIYSFVNLYFMIKNHKPEQLLYTIFFKYIFQRACLNYLTAVNI